MHQGSMLSLFFSAVVIYIVTELCRKGVLSGLMYADDLVMMNKTIKVLGNKFLKWKAAFGSKGLNVDLVKTSDGVLPLTITHYKGWLV